MPGKQTQRGDTTRAYSLGFDFVCAVAGFVLVGIWIDRHYSSGPWGTLICLFLGLIGGFYNLIRGAARMSGGLRPRAPEDAGRGAPDPQPDNEAGSDGESPRTVESWRTARSGGDDRSR
jgi:Putative F0F1-ATPase subunit Ca2+/Mg2+ transporter